ncbi:hypothetical protein ACP46_gp05 [Rhizobium phage RHEph06]|uniref:Uncharacterized protein n=4 Tax=Kleczkowskavirus RHEph4 TaxID=1921526 RepID=A0A7S5UU03_9CAUD|nr:hypothetical protein ACP46_gp05 [Rhizobium phage RHEph06]YP_009598446.1 hypothetical protein FDH25_gp04 [Rhizobium phage RHEph04]QIG67628.1 hypothetical protein EVB51_011 [Rhizobium phage RHph_Y17]QIG68864.1 hypothetical protein EVB71_012 [Rhizobium phage RHph_Y55]QIG68947.1 hypothetical protein EVB73_011 [Rhizobium phage RHph_Y3_43]QIG69496.1 hypothetical protein EVB80_013 [Rhizobium phage RHph_I36]QIG75370.1 hypothetical protein EVC17_013 [Rhizobium phage RHph_Y1_1]QIG75920.1 hypothetic
MSELMRRLARSAKRGEGCHLTPEMVRELVSMRTIRRHIAEERRPPKPRPEPAVVTNKMIREIRELKRANPRMLRREIAEIVGCSVATVQKYSSEKNLEIAKQREAERYALNKDRMVSEALARYHRKKAARETQCSI